MVVVYEVICSDCGNVFHIFSKDRTTKPRDGLRCVNCEIKYGLVNSRNIRALRFKMGGVIMGDHARVLCGYTEESTNFKSRMVGVQ